MSTDKRSSGVSSSPIDVDSIALIDSDNKASDNKASNDKTSNKASSNNSSISTASGNNGQVNSNVEPEPDTKKKKTTIQKSESKLSEEDLRRVNTNKGLLTLLRTKDIKIKDVAADLAYEEELERLQVELVKLQRWVQDKGKRIAIILEGRDAAGKGGTIRRFTEHLNPRSMRVVADEVRRGA